MPKKINSGYMGGWMGAWVTDWMGARDFIVKGIPKSVRDVRVVKFVKWSGVAGFIRSDIAVKFARNREIVKVVSRDVVSKAVKTVKSERLSNIIYRSSAHKVIVLVRAQKAIHDSRVSKAVRDIERVGKIDTTSSVKVVNQ